MYCTDEQRAIKIALKLARKHGCTREGFLGVFQLYNPSTPATVTVFDASGEIGLPSYAYRIVLEV